MNYIERPCLCTCLLLPASVGPGRHPQPLYWVLGVEGVPGSKQSSGGCSPLPGLALSLEKETSPRKRCLQRGETASLTVTSAPPGARSSRSRCPSERGRLCLLRAGAAPARTRRKSRVRPGRAERGTPSSSSCAAAPARPAFISPQLRRFMNI